MVGDQTYELVPVRLAIKAMRDNGYQNTAYAVAELIDNSIQAGASSVDLLCLERRQTIKERERSSIHRIGVLDNGSGMSAEILRMALQFGNGTRLEDRSGIGRFGMGLPNSSISQCRHAQVWTWTDGPENAIYSEIDLDRIERGEQVDVPAPVRRDIPAEWRHAGSTFGSSGTLVVWSELDRCVWKTAKKIIEHSELLIGRMYRYQLDSGQVQIRMAAYDEDGYLKEERKAVANDPLYLMSNTSTPSPWDIEPMFERDGEKWIETVNAKVDGATYPITIKFTIAKQAAREDGEGKAAGSKAWGKHAHQNVGVSIVRAERELQLDKTLANAADTRERWWGVEVSFPPQLDEVFGVTNNKQAATNFVTVAERIKELLGNGDRPARAVIRELELEDDPTAPLVDVICTIRRRLADIRTRVQVQRQNAKRERGQRYEIQGAERTATRATKARQDEGAIGESDKDEALPADDRIRMIVDDLVHEDGITEEQASELVAEAFDADSKYIFMRHQGEGDNFFTVQSKAGEIIIKVNIAHPAFEHLIEVLDEMPEEGASREELAQRLVAARKGLRLLLMAWARYEDEAVDATQRRRLQQTRNGWGSVALSFFESE